MLLAAWLIDTELLDVPLILWTPLAIYAVACVRSWLREEMRERRYQREWREH